MLKARGAIAQVQTNTKRAFDLYTLATQTQGASWLTVEQLLYREAFDATKVNYDPLHSPLQSWGDKVAAALTACRQDAALGKDGSLLGPVAPSVARVLNRGRVMPARPQAGSPSSRATPRFTGKSATGGARAAPRPAGSINSRLRFPGKQPAQASAKTRLAASGKGAGKAQVDAGTGRPATTATTS